MKEKQKRKTEKHGENKQIMNTCRTLLVTLF